MSEERRFAGVQRAYGPAAASRFERCHALIVGLGGVGTWATEALARSGVGRFTLVDLDVVHPSNVNRQLLALTETFGQSKAEVMATRILSINPQAHVRVVDDFLTRDNASAVLTPQPDVILDCCDDAKAKLTLVLHARRHRNVLVVCGAAGGKTDPSRLQVTDLALTVQDPLLARLRKRLRTHHGYPTEPGKAMAIRCVSSDEPMRLPEAGCAVGGLSCDGYGSAVTVTASMGFLAAAEALALVQRRAIRT